ncbi:hypothetical protein C5167_041239 [Papaver somniferum]|uniref:non-specific serine/threonine protein kinase n=1 Tax=Papaver somniferum TaxID=3469 RepID=A0A4Y7ILE8_PAPSO|nr:hypothetical protein C5167_041239 [Papaver somniferum]
MSFLLIIYITLVSLLSLNYSPEAFQSDLTYGNETDRLALLKLKSELTYYYYQQGYLNSWNDSDHCSWTGLKCNREHPRRVTVLELRHTQLGSSFLAIPPDIGNLTFLITLRLMYNGFQGEIPREIGRLFQLQYLDLSYNQLSGEIPSSLANCLDLKGLYLNDNNLKGVIPLSLQSLKGIQELILYRNHLSGPIPEYLKSFHSLETLDLSSNYFSGEVPKKGIFKNTSACPEISISEKLDKDFPLKRLLLISSGVVVCVIILCSFVKFISRRQAKIEPSSSESPSTKWVERCLQMVTSIASVSWCWSCLLEGDLQPNVQTWPYPS